MKTEVILNNSKWSTRHGDAFNSDYYNVQSPSNFTVKKKLLKNIPAATFVAVDEKKNMYVLSLKGNDEHEVQRLSSFDFNGKLKWTSNVMLTSLTSIGLAEEKYLYTTDGKYLYKILTQNGSVIWRIVLKEESSAIMFLSEQEIVILGIKGTLFLYNADGDEISSPYSLPSKILENGVEHKYMPKEESQFTLFEKALTSINVDSSYTKQAVNRFFGRGVAAKNVPAINQKDRIIYLLTSDPSGLKSQLIALKHDQSSKKYSLLFSTLLGPGCDSSPNLSFDCSRIYCTVGNGELYSIDAKNGNIYWTYTLENSSSASINSTEDKCIYISIKDEVVCIQDKEDKAVKIWQSNFTEEGLNAGYSSAFINSVLVISENHVHGILGFCKVQGKMEIPVFNNLFTLDRKNGTLVSTLKVEHESMCTPSFLDQNHLIVPSKPFYKGIKKLNQKTKAKQINLQEDEDFYGVVIYSRN